MGRIAKGSLGFAFICATGCSYPDLLFAVANFDASGDHDSPTTDTTEPDSRSGSEVQGDTASETFDAAPLDDTAAEALSDVPKTLNYRVNSADFVAMPIEGTSGGTSFTMTCPEGSVGVGIEGRVVYYNATTDVIGSVALHCAKVESDGKLGTPTTMPAVGPSSGGVTFTSLCPANAIVVEIYGSHGSVLDRIGLGCAPLVDWVASGAGKMQLALNGGTGGGWPMAYDDVCPKEYAVNQFSGRVQTSYLGGLKATCAHILR
ncbi:MAG: hypothetical protein NVS3B20_19520 [Polyangiales bacterium]